MKKIILTLLFISLGSLQAAMPAENIIELQKELLWATERGDLDIVQRLITAPGININYQDSNGQFALTLAAQNGHTETVQALITAGANVNLQDAQGYTALMLAATLGRTDTVQALITSPTININHQGVHGNTALMRAAYYGHTDTVQVLINNPNTDMNVQNNPGNTALMIATQRQDMPTVYALTGAGANLYLQNHAGQCPAEILIKESRAKTKGTGNHQS